MKNKREFAIAVAALVALISLSSTASQRPLSEGRQRPFPGKPYPTKKFGQQRRYMEQPVAFRPAIARTTIVVKIDPSIRRIRDPKKLHDMINRTRREMEKDRARLRAGVRSARRKQQLNEAIDKAKSKIDQYKAQLASLRNK